LKTIYHSSTLMIQSSLLTQYFNRSKANTLWHGLYCNILYLNVTL